MRHASVVRRLGLAAAAGAGAFLVSNCGGSDGSSGGASPTGPAAAAATSYFKAIDAADGQRACALLTPRAQRTIAQLQSTSCPRAIADAARTQPEVFRGRVLQVVATRRDTATVEVEGAAGRDEVRLERSGRTWRISDAPGLGQ